MSEPATTPAGTPVRGAVALVTGGGSGIGAALVRRFVRSGASAVIVADRDAKAAAKVAGTCPDVGRATIIADTTDVARGEQVESLIERTVDRFGRLDIVCSNAGIAPGAGVTAPDEEWNLAWKVNTLSHVHVAHYALPHMLEAGSGHLIITASAAGLLTSPGDAAYAVTKHGAVALAEWLAVQYGGRGVAISALCPLGVATPLLMDPLEAGHSSAQTVAASGTIIEPDQVADTVLDALADGRFLILPHPEVATYWAQKASDPDRWLAGVRRLVARKKSTQPESGRNEN